MLLKKNLAPTMGRRDAALDRATELLNSDWFSLSDNKHLAAGLRLSRLLAQAEEDCGYIRSCLSNPDTLAREKRIHAFISTLAAYAQVLEDNLRIRTGALSRSADVLREMEVISSSLLLNEDRSVSDAEITLVNRMRDFVSRATPRLSRYREYAKKSFSPVYADRYKRSYESYFDVYARNDF